MANNTRDTRFSNQGRPSMYAGGRMRSISVNLAETQRMRLYAVAAERGEKASALVCEWILEKVAEAEKARAEETE